MRVLALPAGTDPDSFVQQQGAAAYREKLKESKPYLDYLAERARGDFDLRSQEGKIAALNFLLPYLARVPSKIRRAEWASELAQRLAIDEALVREELHRAAQERRTEIRLRPEAKAIVERGAAKPAERRLLQILLDNPGIRADILKEMEDAAAHCGGGLEKVFGEVLAMARSEEAITSATLAERLPESEQRLVYELAFEEKGQSAGTLEEARSCLAAMQRRKLEAELRAVQQQILEAERAKNNNALRELLMRKQELRQSLTQLD